jgi:hypothetical protein
VKTGNAEVEPFLCHLAATQEVTASTQIVAGAALLKLGILCFTLLAEGNSRPTVVDGD